MSYIIKEKSNFTPCPEGVHNAVCVDLVELPNTPTPYGVKDLIRLVFETDVIMEQTGKPFLVVNRYTPSLNKKSNLRKHLKSWRGRDFTNKELAEFDLESIIGTSCQLSISHNESSSGDVFANIDAVIKAKEKLKPTGNYVRVKDRPENEGKFTKKEEHNADNPF